jgi:hypothetical protein
MAQQEQKKPNILIIFGDDIGITNLSCYSDGLMGYETPNIDRIAREGLRFLHYYGEQSCTAGALCISHRSAYYPQRLEQSRFSGCADGHEPARSLHRRAAQEPWVCHRPVRQES